MLPLPNLLTSQCLRASPTSPRCTCGWRPAQQNRLYAVAGYERSSIASPDVFFISISLTPDRDTPARLKACAAEQGCRDGWYFLTGQMADVDRPQESRYAWTARHSTD